MPKLSIISHFYNHPTMVEQQIAHWQSIAPEFLRDIEFILVDDCSEELPTIVRGNLDLRLFRITSDIMWNQAGARNLGTYHASGDWALFFDIDQKLMLDTVPLLLANLDTLQKQTMYYLRIKELIDVTVNQPLSNHPNTFLVPLADFKVMGRYDEDFTGHYGYEDLYLPRVWEAAGGKRAMLNTPIFFEDMKFGTGNFNRDLSRNQTLALQKVAAGCRNSPGILRFDWQEVPLA